jgi:hypothetical protein
MHMQNSYKLKTHDDVPKYICKQLKAEKQQLLKRHKKTTRTTTASHPPITITNVLLALPY